jgi:ribosomal protein S1
VNISSGTNVPNPGKYLQPGNRIMVKVQSMDSDEVQASVGISAMGKQR